MPKTQTVAAAVIVKDDLVLVQKRADKEPDLEWCFPGGVVEIGEDLETAVVREIMEEAGIVIAPVRILGDKTVGRGDNIFHVVYFLCTYISGEPQVMEPRESEAIEWVSLDKAPTLVGRDYMPFIRDYFESLKA
jgi:8-oxo-dGTP diphosphatase